MSRARVGDLVEYFDSKYAGGPRFLRKGIIVACSRCWWVGRGLVEIQGCIVSRKDIRRIVRRRYISLKILRYLRSPKGIC